MMQLVSFVFHISLDAEDPLAVLLMIDFFAIKSDQHDFLLRLYNEWEVIFLKF